MSAPTHGRIEWTTYHSHKVLQGPVKPWADAQSDLAFLQERHGALGELYRVVPASVDEAGPAAAPDGHGTALGELVSGQPRLEQVQSAGFLRPGQVS